MFELVEIDTVKLIQDSSYKPRQVKAIDLAILPEQLNYRLASRDALTQTQSKVFVHRFDFQPEKVRFAGSFGDDERWVNNVWLDGWKRLKQFEEEIVRRSKQVKNNRILYAVNYYDFMFQRFGAINIDSWALTANARTNANLITYSLDFTIVDKLYSVNLIDALIKNLLNGLMYRNVNDLNLYEILMFSGLSYAQFGLDILSSLDNYLENAISSVADINKSSAFIGKVVKGVFG